MVCAYADFSKLVASWHHDVVEIDTNQDGAVSRMGPGASLLVLAYIAQNVV
jgi:hypothetical protein